MDNFKGVSGRFFFLDAIRGIAAVLVVLSHSLGAIYPGFNIGNYHNYMDPGFTGVATFFFVSGFIIPFSLERIGSVKVFFVNRFFRIFPLYLLILILAIILLPLNALGWASFTQTPFLHLFTHFLLLQDYLPKNIVVYSLVLGAWTLLLELVWYIIFAIIYFFGLNKKNDLLLITANFFIIALACTAYFLNIRIINNRPVLILCSFIGLYIYRYVYGEIPIKRFILMLCFSCATIVFSSYISFRIFKSEHTDFTSILQSYAIALLIFWFFYFFYERMPVLFQKPLAFLGKISYSFYLGHGLILILWSFFIGHPDKWLSIIPMLGICIIWAYFLFNYIETPAINFGKKMVRRNFSTKKLLK